jgi:prophage antirepressor-like protein
MNENLEKPGDRSSAETRIALFKGKEIRKAIHNNEWWFVINDIIATLADSLAPAQYFKRRKQRDSELSNLINKGGVQFVPPLMLKGLTGRIFAII